METMQRTVQRYSKDGQNIATWDPSEVRRPGDSMMGSNRTLCPSFLLTNCAFMMSGFRSEDFDESEFPVGYQEFGNHDSEILYQDGGQQPQAQWDEIYEGKGRNIRGTGPRRPPQGTPLKHAIQWPHTGQTKTPPKFASGLVWRRVRDTLESCGWMDARCLRYGYFL